LHLSPISGLSACCTYVFSFAKRHPIISVAITIITTSAIYNYLQNQRIAREREERFRKNEAKAIRLKDAIQKLSEVNNIYHLTDEHFTTINTVFTLAKMTNLQLFPQHNSLAYNISVVNIQNKNVHINNHFDEYASLLKELNKKENLSTELTNLANVLRAILRMDRSPPQLQ
jgi:hypothetical protein